MSKSIFDKIRERSFKDKQNHPNRKKFFRTSYVPYGRLIGRVLPKHPDQELPFLVVGRHFNVVKYPILCPTITTSAMDDQKPCPICEFVEQLQLSNEQDDKELAKNISVSVRYLWYFIIRKIIHPDGRVEIPEQEPVLLELPPTAHNDLISKYYIKSDVSLDSPMDMEVDENQIFHFDDPDTGVDVIIKKTNGTPVKYSVDLDPTTSALGTPEEVVRWMESIKNLDEYVPAQLESYEKLESLIIGGGASHDDEDPDDDDNAPLDADPEPEPEPVRAPAKAAPAAPKAKSGNLADLVQKNMKRRGKN